MATHTLSLDFDGCTDLIALCPPEQRYQPKKAQQWLQDAYSCLFTGSPEKIKISRPMRKCRDYSREALLANCPSFAIIKEKLESLTDADKLVLYLGSNRQSDQWDRTLQKEKNQALNAVQCTEVLAEVLKNSGEKGNVEFKSSVRLQGITRPKNNGKNDKKVPVENTKFMLLLQQMHDAKSTPPGAQVEFTFIDDKENIIKRANNFFNTYPFLIPAGVTLHLKESNIFGRYIKREDYPPIDGIG